MFCEVCGKESKKLKKVLIEGAAMNACPECAKLASAEISSGNKFTSESLRIRIESLTKRRESGEEDLLEEDEFLVEDYGERVKNARERLGLTQEELALKINEKSSVIAKIERYEFRPDKNLIKKLEKFLGIKLTEKVE